jgi:hypothetical protein
VAALATAAQRARAASSRATSSVEAPFWGPVHGRRPLPAEQGVVDLGGGRDLGLTDPRVEAGQVDAVQVGQGGAARAKLGPGRVQQPSAERLDHAGAAVGAGAAPDAQDDLAAAQVEGGPDQLAGAAAGRGGGRRPPAGEPPQPRRLGQLDHRHLVADGQGGRDGLAGGAGAAHLRRA